MAKITFENKENIDQDSIPRKNQIVIEDLNEVKESVNALYDTKHDKLIVLTQTQYNTLNPVDQSKFYFIVG
jgi:ribosome biogenesis SPOUT family RNA methylase Rps3